MAIKIKFNNGIPEPPQFILAHRNGRKICAIKPNEIKFRDSMMGTSEIFFLVYKDECSDCWDQIRDFKLLYCREYDTWYEIHVDIDDGDAVTKNIHAVSLGEAELGQTNLYDIEINTEDDILRDDYSPTVLYNESNKSVSLLDRLIEKAPHYHVDHVDVGINDIQRSFGFDNKTIYDALQEVATEIDLHIDVRCRATSQGAINRSIRVYDLEDCCLDCSYRGKIDGVCENCGSTNIRPGYGSDTHIFISKDNLAKDINYSTNVDSVKNCFRLGAGDDLMTATIRSCNPNGSDYLWYLSDDLKDDMSDALKERLASYDALYDYYNNTCNFEMDSEINAQYNNLIQKYQQYNLDLQQLPLSIIGFSGLTSAYYDVIDFKNFLSSALMPEIVHSDTTAQEQADIISGISPSTISVSDLGKLSSYSANSSVLNYIKLYIDYRYSVNISSSNFNQDTKAWSGELAIKSRSDDSDSATCSAVFTFDDDYESFVNQKIKNALLDKSDNGFDIVSIFNKSYSEFQAELGKYNLSYLRLFYDSCQAVLNIMIQQGIPNTSDIKTQTDRDVYNNIYLPYYEKLGAIMDEISTRESEIDLVENGVQGFIEEKRAFVQAELNFQDYVGEELWTELISYKREDTYKNDNYISDGLNNSELISNANQFISSAKEAIIKSATLQHSIKSSLKNLLMMQEFSSIVDYFECGNWIRMPVDGVVYRLRLIEYEIDYDDPENITVEYSDVCAVNDHSSLMEKIQSMATSYGDVVRQADKGKKSNSLLSEWVERGLSLTTLKIINNADNQDVCFDENGLLCRRLDDLSGDYDDKQLKIINNGLYVTDDNWRTSKAGIGEFICWDPVTNTYKLDYGIIAKKLIGNLVLSENVGVYNTNNSITLDENGLIVTTNGTDDDTKDVLFTIRRKTTDQNNSDSYEDIMYVDEDGHLVLNGSVNIVSTSSDGAAETKELLAVLRDQIIGNTQSNFEDIYNRIASLEILPGQIEIIAGQIEENNGVYTTKVKGFSFSDDGLIISNPDREIGNRIDETGMYVTKTIGSSSENVLVANNDGVNAINLSAEKFLTIGRHSRFEDYGESRTACFYIE